MHQDRRNIMKWYHHHNIFIPFDEVKKDTNLMMDKQAVLSHIWSLSVLLCHVFLKITRHFAGETALIAGVGLFTSVSASVHFQTIRSSARIVALITLERFHSWMGQNMSVKVESMFAWEVTLCATEALFSRVCQHVGPEMTSTFARVVVCS